MRKPQAYHRPRTLDEMWRLKETDPDARFIAGGTDLMVGPDLPRALISLRSIPGLDGIEMGPPTRIGALTLVAEVLAHRGIAARFPTLTQACHLFASMQIRNAATVGGNLCNASPAADLAPPLLVHGATVRLSSPGGAREMPLEEFFLGPGRTALAPGEILTDVFLNPPPAGAATTFLRKTRVRMDIALISVAVLLELEGARCKAARIAAGAVAPTPLRLKMVEALLEGESITPQLAAEAGALAAQSVEPVDDIRTTAAYRRHMVGVYVKRALEELVS
ncbi:MAG: FAD binding domain-containing protein [Planctomycetota bacterium]